MNALTAQPIRYCGLNVGAKITLTDDGNAVLEWTDYVANDWTETFASMPLALARLAVLSAIDNETFGEHAVFFVRETAEFAVSAQAFLAGEVQE